MDGAHNPDGAKVLADHVVACDVHPAVFFGAMKDKDLMAMKSQLLRMSPRSITGIVGKGDRWPNAEQLRSVLGNDLAILDIQQVADRLKEKDEGTRLVTDLLSLETAHCTTRKHESISNLCHLRLSFSCFQNGLSIPETRQNLFASP